MIKAAVNTAAARKPALFVYLLFLIILFLFDIFTPLYYSTVRLIFSIFLNIFNLSVLISVLYDTIISCVYILSKQIDFVNIL